MRTEPLTISFPGGRVEPGETPRAGAGRELFEETGVRAELLEVDGRKLRFKVEAHDEDKKVGDGTHRRAIIAIQRKG